MQEVYGICAYCALSWKHNFTKPGYNLIIVFAIPGFGIKYLINRIEFAFNASLTHLLGISLFNPGYLPTLIQMSLK